MIHQAILKTMLFCRGMCNTFTEENKSSEQPRGLPLRHKAAVAPFIPSTDRVLMIIARTMPCMCQTIGK